MPPFPTATVPVTLFAVPPIESDDVAVWRSAVPVELV